MGKSDAERYAKEVVLPDFEKPGDDDVIPKLVTDLAAAGKPAAGRCRAAGSDPQKDGVVHWKRGFDSASPFFPARAVYACPA